jgi:hypothetical protein
MLEKLLLKKKSLFLLLFLIFNFVFINFAFCALGGLDTTAKNAGYSDNDLEGAAGDVIAVVISLVGVIFFVIIIIGGLVWMTSGGNDTKIEKAKKIILAGIIGLTIVLFAYIITHSLAELI